MSTRDFGMAAAVKVGDDDSIVTHTGSKQATGQYKIADVTYRHILGKSGSEALFARLYLVSTGLFTGQVTAMMPDDAVVAVAEKQSAKGPAKEMRGSVMIGTRKISFTRSEKGALSVYGMGRFPVTLYPEQWELLLNPAVVAMVQVELATNRADYSSKPTKE